MMTSTYIGGEHDVLVDALVTRLVTRSEPMVHSVLLDGAAGSGKSSLVHRAVEVAQRHITSEGRASVDGRDTNSKHCHPKAPHQVVDAVRCDVISALDAFASYRRPKAPTSNATAGPAPTPPSTAIALPSISDPPNRSSVVATNFTSQLHCRIDNFRDRLAARQKEDYKRGAVEGTIWGTLCVILDRFDLFLTPSGATSNIAGGGDDVDHGSPSEEGDTQLRFAPFAGELFAWVKGSVDGMIQLEPSSQGPPMSSGSVDTSGDASPAVRIKLVFVVTTSSPMPSGIPVSMRRLWFHDEFVVPPLREIDRESFFSAIFQTWIEETSCVCDVDTISKALASRTGGLVFAGLVEVAETFQRLACETLPAVLFTSKGFEGFVEDLCDTTLRVFFASGTQQAIAAKQRMGYVDVAKTQWADIAGHSQAKEILKQLVAHSREDLQWMESLGVIPRCGVVLHGPPGTGKTMLAKAMATELHASFLFMDLSQLLHSEVGESERTLESFFATAKRRSPCVMFVDELQSAFGTRHASHSQSTGSSHDSRLVSAFLALLDNAVLTFYDAPVIFIGATNVKDHLDPLLLRPGRLDTHIFIGNPDADARRALVTRMVDKQWMQWWSDNASSTATTNRVVCRHVNRVLKHVFVMASEGMSGAELTHALNIFALTVFWLRQTPNEGNTGKNGLVLHWTMLVESEVVQEITVDVEGLPKGLRDDIVVRALQAAFPKFYSGGDETSNDSGRSQWMALLAAAVTATAPSECADEMQI